MEQKKKKVSAILYDRLSERVVELAGELNKTTNELINAFVEECVWQIDDDPIPRSPIETVKLARLIQRRNLTLGERYLQEAVKVFFPNLDDEQESWRNYVLEEANAQPGGLTKEIMDKIKLRADKMVSEDARAQRRLQQFKENSEAKRRS